MTFNEVRGRPLFRMYLAHRDRVVRLGDAPAEMTVSFSEANHLKIDAIVPTNAVRGLSETAERTETVALFLDSGESSTPQRLSVQYGYFSRTQAAAVVAVPLVLLLLGYSVGPLVDARGCPSGSRPDISVPRPPERGRRRGSLIHMRRGRGYLIGLLEP